MQLDASIRNKRHESCGIIDRRLVSQAAALRHANGLNLGGGALPKVSLKKALRHGRCPAVARYALDQAVSSQTLWTSHDSERTVGNVGEDPVREVPSKLFQFHPVAPPPRT